MKFRRPPKPVRWLSEHPDVPVAFYIPVVGVGGVKELGSYSEGEETRLMVGTHLEGKRSEWQGGVGVQRREEACR